MSGPFDVRIRVRRAALDEERGDDPGVRHERVLEVLQVHAGVYPSRVIDELEDAAPTCPLCMHRLEPAGDDGAPYWWCPACSFVALSV